MSASDSIKRASILVASWPVFLIALAVLLFYPFMALWGLGLFQWQTMQIITYAYVVLAPLPALLFYSLQKKSERAPTEGAKRRTGLFYGAFFISLLLSIAAYFLSNRLLLDLIGLSQNPDAPADFNAFAQPIIWFVKIAICVVAFLWLLCILSARRRGRFAPALFFLFSAMLATMWHFIQVFYAMDLEAFNVLDLGAELFAIMVYLILAAIGMVFWCIVQISAWRKEKRAAKAAKAAAAAEVAATVTTPAAAAETPAAAVAGGAPTTAVAAEMPDAPPPSETEEAQG